jgi:hypothetical protein
LDSVMSRSSLLPFQSFRSIIPWIPCSTYRAFGFHRLYKLMSKAFISSAPRPVRLNSARLMGWASLLLVT